MRSLPLVAASLLALSPVAPVLALGAVVFSVSGCGGPAAPVPSAVVGAYAVSIASGGKTDSGIVMSVTLGSNMNVLLTFTDGIYGEIRCQLIGSTQLVLPRQTVEVDHSSGQASGIATGSGTIGADGSVDITLTLSGDGNVDGGDASSYHITGKKQ